MDTAFVTPFLFGLKGSDIDASSPLLQFQYASYNRSDILKLVKDIYAATKSTVLDDLKLTKTFENWWPDLDAKFQTLLKQESEYISIPKDKTSKDKTSQDDNNLNGVILEELLNLARTQEKMLNNPEAILPPDYLNYVMGANPKNVHPGAIEDLNKAAESLDFLIRDLKDLSNEELSSKLKAIYKELYLATNHIEMRLSKRGVSGRRKTASVPDTDI
ncbi:hypothetical protein [Peribacillus sp. NPDC058075]|uniref:hypothetical protein n=1 Tax=unclassified Peribacillus TaxID=2675266 RepID=UPI0036DB2C00